MKKQFVEPELEKVECALTARLVYEGFPLAGISSTCMADKKLSVHDLFDTAKCEQRIKWDERNKEKCILFFSRS